MKKVLVTGGTGVTGAALIRHLLSMDIEVIALIRPESPRLKYLPEDERLHIVFGDMEDYLKFEGKLEPYFPVDVFFHLAWDGSRIVDKLSSRDNMPLQALNIVYTTHAVELCHKIGCRIFLMTGSQAEFGAKEGKINEKMSSLPENGYGTAKLCAENMTRIMCRNYGIRHICARLFSVYGPYDGTNSLIYTSVLKLLNHEAPCYTKGEQRWDFLYSFDAARALCLLAENGRDGEMYCVASGKSDSLANYIRTIHDVVNPMIKPDLGKLEYSPKAVMHLEADIGKLRQDTGFEPYVAFSEGIKKIMEWCIEEKKGSAL